MLLKIVIPTLIVLHSYTAYVKLMHTNLQAAMARPTMDLPRSIACGELLARPDWVRNRIEFEIGSLDRVLTPEQRERLRTADERDLARAEAGSFDRPAWPQARAFVGDVATLDDQTLLFLHDVDYESRKNLVVTGDKAIRGLLRTVTQRLPLFHETGTEPPAWLGRWQTFKDYESAQFAHELGDFDRVLNDYATGKNRSAVVIGAARLTAADNLWAFALDGALASLRGRNGDTFYLWHILYFDKERQTPVWRVGLGRNPY